MMNISEIKLKELKNSAIEMSQILTVYFPQYQEKSAVYYDSDAIEQLEQGYDIRNQIVAFVHEGVQYVIPNMSRVLKILEENKFVHKSMNIPFSYGEYPIEPAKYAPKWHSLMKQAIFENDCIQFSNEKGYGIINLDECFEVPKEGLNIRCLGYDYKFFPMIDPYCFRSIIEDRIGHFCQHNGICLFVYRDGTTYVTRNSIVVDHLLKNGYKKMKFNIISVFEY